MLDLLAAMAKLFELLEACSQLLLGELQAAFQLLPAVVKFLALLLEFLGLRVLFVQLGFVVTTLVVEAALLFVA